MTRTAPSHPSNPPRIVVTGAGIVTALGLGWAANLDGFRTGRSGFAPVSLFDVSRHRARSAAAVVLPDPFPPGNLSPKRRQRADRAGLLLLLAARETLAAARLTPEHLSRPVPVVLATTSAGMNRGQEFYRHAVHPAGRRTGQTTRLAEYFVGRHLADLNDDLGLAGPFTTLANACASGSNAIGHAWECLRAGEAQVAIAGGYDALSLLVFAGFDALQALSVTTCRPFDRNRDGLGLGEGAALLALETLDHAHQRGAPILAEITGYGLSTDLHHLTQPHPQGLAAVASMTRACEAAGIDPSAVDYINAHGTGTPLNDAAEAAAINAWAGSCASRIAVSSTKGSVGHLLGAAGAVEAVVCTMALRHQFLPPMPSLLDPDPACGFPLVTRSTAAARLEVVLSNSFGFGGSNATLVFRRWSTP